MIALQKKDLLEFYQIILILILKMLVMDLTDFL